MIPSCKTKNCCKPLYARGLCHGCYMRWYNSKKSVKGLNAVRAVKARKLRAKEGRCSKCGAKSLEKGLRTCRECIDAIKSQQRATYAERKEKGLCVNCGIPERPRKYGLSCEICGMRMKQYGLRIKQEVMKKYGGACTCCGETRLAFLTIDHVNDDGAEKRRAGIHGKGIGIYRLLKRTPRDLTLRILCWNCNLGRRATGVCPHVDDRAESRRTGT